MCSLLVGNATVVVVDMSACNLHPPVTPWPAAVHIRVNRVPSLCITPRHIDVSRRYRPVQHWLHTLKWRVFNTRCWRDPKQDSTKQSSSEPTLLSTPACTGHGIAHSKNNNGIQQLNLQIHLHPKLPLGCPSAPSNLAGYALGPTTTKNPNSSCSIHCMLPAAA
jgi:hypothetical protein